MKNFSLDLMKKVRSIIYDWRVYIGTNTLENKCVVPIKDVYFSLYSMSLPRNLSKLGILRSGMLWTELCPRKIHMLKP